MAVDVCFRPVSEVEAAVCATSVLPGREVIPFARSPAAATRSSDCACPSNGDAVPLFGSAEGEIDTGESTVSPSRSPAEIEGLLLPSGLDELDAKTFARFGCDPALIFE